MWPRTQKARGLMALGAGLSCGTWPAKSTKEFCVVPSWRVSGERPFPWIAAFGSSIGVDLGNSKVNFPCFARPCPITPKHGFVESRSVYDVQAAMDVLAKTLAVDPKGEMILMQRFSGRYSGVANNAGVVWGFNHDGVTSGGDEDATFFIPAPVCASVWNPRISSPIRSGVKECAYLELVEHDGETRLVQLRDGPAQEHARGDYIPKQTTVKRIISPLDVDRDLLLWDKLVRNSASGTVAVLSEDTSRFNHFAVHCIVHKIPIVFGETPDLGTKLMPVALERPTPLGPEDYETIANVIMSRLTQRAEIREAGPHSKSNDEIPQVVTAVGVCHAMVDWGNEPHLLRLRGEGIAACFRFSATACVGELRYFFKHGPGQHLRNGPPHTRMNLVIRERDMATFAGKGKVDRSGIFSQISKLPFGLQISLVTQAHADFARRGWERSFGGQSWAEATRQTAWLGRSIASFCEKPDRRRWTRLQSRYNATLHACHNNGKVLTKWVPSCVLTFGGKAPTLCFLNSFAAKCVLGLFTSPDPDLTKDLFKKELNYGL